MGFSQAHQEASLNFDNLVLRSLLVGPVIALMLVFLAPTFDHHFSERQHYHSHLFLNASAASQGHPDFHPFEQSHSHFGFDDQDSESDGILYQTSNNQLRESGSVSFTAIIDNSLTHIIHGNETLSFAIATRESSYPEFSPSPPTRPPLA